MKKTLFLFAVLFILPLLFISCSDEPVETAPTRVANPVAIYEDALSLQKSREYTALDTLHTKRILHNTEKYSETVVQQISFIGDSDISIMQDIYYSDQPLSVQLMYSENNGYLQFGSTTFSQEMDREAFTEAYIAAPLPDPYLYAAVEGTVTDSGTVISFRDATSAESWAMADGGQHEQTTAYVLIGADGKIQFVSYHISYRLEESGISEYYCFSYVPANPEIPFTLPEYSIAVEDLQYPLLPERASGLLLQSENHIRANYAKSINSQVTDVSYNENKYLSLDHHEGTRLATVRTAIELTDHSRGDVVTAVHQTETFEDGVYSISKDGEEPQAEPNVTEAAFHTYIHNLLLENILLPQYIQGVTVAESENTLRLQFQVSEALGPILADEASKTLYQDQSLQVSLAETTVTNHIFSYLEIDTILGLPQKAGLTFTGSHMLDNTVYGFSCESHIEYLFE